MRHIYASYEIPAPVIKEPATVVEDVAGNLTSTHTLICSLIGDIENLQDIGRRMTENPASICADAWKARLEGIWALGNAIDGRLKDDIILLYALVDHSNAQDEPQAPPAYAYRPIDTSAWDAAVTAYRDASAKVHGSDEEIDAATGPATEALNELIHLRAPDLDAVLVKMDIVAAEGVESEGGYKSIMDDIRVLNGGIEA